MTAAVATAVAAADARSHGFGQRYDLPVPLWLYLTGAAAAVAVSFLLSAIFVRAQRPAQSHLRLNLLRFALPRLLTHRYVRTAARAVALMLYVLVLIAGFIGAQNPFKNVAPIMVWAIWWVGMPYVCALIGNLWALVNPIDSIFVGLRWLFRHRARDASPPLRYPAWLAAWPAVVTLLVFEWGELVWTHSDSPLYIASALLAYTALTLIAMALFGRESWLTNGEAFSMVYGLLARFAPTEVRVGGTRVAETWIARTGSNTSARAHPYAPSEPASPDPWEWNLRPYAAGLLTEEPAHVSLLALVVLMLASVTFDGFVETPAWASFLEVVNQWFPLTDGAGGAGGSRELVYTASLLAFAGAFFGIYLAFSYAMAKAAAVHARAHAFAESHYAPLILARFFILTLLPIAIAYHIAHYLSFLLMAGQYLIPLASDPFGFGWDLFGTKRYFVRIAIIDARVVWYTSVGAIVAGHIAAVYLAHVMALRVFRDRRMAMASQYPLLVLMIGYTMVSLWIIAQPIVTDR